MIFDERRLLKKIITRFLLFSSKYGIEVQLWTIFYGLNLLL